jgi:hypothetical protein
MDEIKEIEEKWEKEAIETVNKLEPLTKGARFHFIAGYLQGCRKRQEEIGGLKVKINHLAEDIKQMEETIRGVNGSAIRKHFDRSYRSKEQGEEDG